MTWRRPHWRERPSHPEDDLRPHEGNKSAHAYQFALARMPRTGMEDERFFHQQANWCYQLAWQCFDLAVAHELNLMGNELRRASFGRRTEGTADAEARRS